jgi:hypothetical protein
MSMSKRTEIVCRLIADDDVEQVIDCLERGFPERRRTYWTDGISRMSRRETIGDFPRYGYCLQTGERIVGVVLLICSRRGAAGGRAIRCNLSSWCVDKEYRSHALALHMMAVKRKEATYLNISPAEHTRATMEALGFRRFSNGQILFAPALSRAERDTRVLAFAAGAPEAMLLPQHERQVLAEHAAFGCRALICLKNGLAYPFVFQHRKIARGLIACPQLVYCRSLDEFVRFSGAIGRHLFFRVGPFCRVDAIAPVGGLVGGYFPEREPKYFKGPDPPGLGDLAYTELVIFGP